VECFPTLLHLIESLQSALLPYRLVAVSACCCVSLLLSSQLFMAWWSYPLCSFLGVLVKLYSVSTHCCCALSCCLREYKNKKEEKRLLLSHLRDVEFSFLFTRSLHGHEQCESPSVPYFNMIRVTTLLLTQTTSAITAWCIRCTADGVYLQPLADKFARLVLQLLARYAFWVAEGIASTKTSSGAATPSQDGLVNPQVQKEKKTSGKKRLRLSALI